MNYNRISGERSNSAVSPNRIIDPNTITSGNPGVIEKNISDTPQDFHAHTSDNSITETPKETFESIKPKTARVISSLPLNVRSGPSKINPIISTVNPGTKLLVEYIKDGWAHIYTDISGENGVEGYVMAEFIKVE
jgi:uncharacterized protein YgiM (DUF1202 family)